MWVSILFYSFLSVLAMLILMPEHPSLHWEYQRRSQVKGAIRDQRSFMGACCCGRRGCHGGGKFMGVTHLFEKFESHCFYTSRSLRGMSLPTYLLFR